VSSHFHSGWLQEIRFATRSLRRTPGFAAIAIVSLALGLALATTTLAISNAYLIRSLPFPESNRLYHLMYAPPGPYEPRGMNEIDWVALDDVVEATVISGSEAYYLGEAGSTQFVRATRVSPGFISGLGVRPVMGHVFALEDFEPGRPAVAMLGHSLWRDRFNADLNIVGREILATPENLSTPPGIIRIVGVLPPGFWFGRSSDARVDMLVPLRTRARPYMVRLRSGVPVALAERRITEAARAVGSDFRPGWAGVHLVSAHERYVAELRPWLTGINIATALVFILVCTNVAILILLRALRRQKDVAVRIALGAERRHLLRMLIAEAGLICASALALAVAVTAIALRTLAPVIEARLGRPPPGGPSAIGVDLNVATMIAGLGVLVALSFALVPMLASQRDNIADMLRRSGPGATDGPIMRRLRSILIAFEVAGALVLLVGGGLMIRSLVTLTQTELGFDAAHVARIRLVLPSTYRDRPMFAQFYRKLGERLTATHAVSAVGSSFPPFYETHKRPLESDASRGVSTPVGGLAVGAGHFSVHGIGLRAGREFLLTDDLQSEPVAVVSESLARQFWPGGAAMGRRVRGIEESVPDAPLGPWRTIVGVARDVRQTYDDHDLRDVYFPYLQAPTRFANVQVRTDRAGAVPLARMSSVVAELDPFVRVEEPRFLAAEDQQFARAQFMTALLGGFAAFSCLLALLGIYGVTSYTVQQREREIAIRLAIGATPRAVVTLFLKGTAVVLAIGVVAGLLGAGALGRVLENQLHGVEPFDASILAIGTAILVTAGLVATWLPARRSATANPVAALKEG
jgi:putative ABC transport system permease protein